jgi:hypothetical protein
MATVKSYFYSRYMIKVRGGVRERRTKGVSGEGPSPTGSPLYYCRARRRILFCIRAYEHMAQASTMSDGMMAGCVCLCFLARGVCFFSTPDDTTVPASSVGHPELTRFTLYLDCAK